MALADTLQRIYWRLEARLAPGVRFAQADFEERLFATLRADDDWLDVGCGHNLLPEWRAPQERELVGRARRLVGLDPELAALRNHKSIELLVCGDAGTLPFADGSFDLVTANMVVEHLADPESQFAEIARVLKPGGRFVFHTPNSDGYPTLMARLVPDAVRGWAARTLERRPAEDRFPTYYRANTPADIQRIAGRSGFVPDALDLVRSTAMFWMFTPIAVIELLFLRALGSPVLRSLRPNLIAVLRKAA